ncbi:hypothetical protein HIM_04719 [Hirsutella minnesotensis 3608]|uniref:Molybdate-anion transporter n=1 Tax=Hirsutella minnesotensis 3608 TaxID=1043627 RepID=A0A0F7ZPQ2_9HYPO|nr:hypothetical protein HIM_04719 [Hirsutella minnesotensis 3608]
MDSFTANVVGLCLINAVAIAANYRYKRSRRRALKTKTVEPVRLERARQLRWRFLFVYSLAACVEWIQGPHLYALYRYKKGISEENVSHLYATGFTAAAIAALCAGRIMDRLGTTVGCQFYFLLTCGSCCTLMSNRMPILVLGRAFGGTATTFLWSAFECWIIQQRQVQGFDETVLPLKRVFGKMTLLSSAVAICMGIASDALVRVRGSLLDPFLAAAVCSVVAVASITGLWRHYSDPDGTPAARGTTSELGPWELIQDHNVVLLASASAVLEAALYIFVFLWTAAFKSLQDKAGKVEPLPLGTIFAGFMSAMMMGSTLASAPWRTFSKQAAKFDMVTILLIASLSLTCAVLADSEQKLFWAFCVFEACIGAFYPTVSYLKSQAIRGNSRNIVYGMFRLPVNLLVLTWHLNAVEGVVRRHSAFLVFALFLLQFSLLFRLSVAFAP